MTDYRSKVSVIVQDELVPLIAEYGLQCERDLLFVINTTLRQYAKLKLIDAAIADQLISQFGKLVPAPNAELMPIEIPVEAPLPADVQIAGL